MGNIDVRNAVRPELFLFQDRGQ